MTAQTIATAQIDASDRLRPVEQSIVDGYAGIAEERMAAGLSPLIQPIVVRSSGDGYKLTAGANRLAALASLGVDRLTVGSDVIIRDEDSLSARKSEIYENLAQPGMTALDRAIFLAEAKKIADAERGETRGRMRKDQQFKDIKKSQTFGIISSERFSKVAASRLGLSESSIKEAIHIVKAIDPLVIPDLRGTMIEDNQNELKQLAAVDHKIQRNVVAAIKGGEVKTVAQARVAIGVDKPKTDDLQARVYADLLDRWSKASNKTKRQFMADVGLVYAEKDEKA